MGPALTIDERVENVLPVLLDQVVDVPENSAVQAVSAHFFWLLARSYIDRAGHTEDLPHSEATIEECST